MVKYIKEHKKISIVVFIILLIVMWIIFSLMFSPSLTRTEITRLINGSNKYTNYTLTSIITSDAGTEEIVTKVKDSIHTLKTNEIYIWENSETNELIWMDLVNKTATTSGVDIQFQQQTARLGNKYFVYLNDENYSYLYKGEKTLNDAICIVAEFKNLNSGIWMDLWIEKSTGIVLKEVYYSIDENGKKIEASFIKEYSIILNNVLDQDVQKPDFTDYNLT